MKYKIITTIILGIDLLNVWFGYILSYWIHTDSSVTFSIALDDMLRVTPYLLLIYFVAFAMLRLYHTLLRDVSVNVGVNIVIATIIATASTILLREYTAIIRSLPMNTILISFFVITLIMELNHFHYRILSIYKRKIIVRSFQERIVIYGAGNAGRLALKELQTNDKYQYRIIGFIDDDPQLKGLTIKGVPVLGDGSMLGDIVKRHRVDHVIIAIQRTNPKQRKQVINKVLDTGVVNVSLMSSLSLDKPHAQASPIRKIEIHDLLNRDVVHLDTDHINECLFEQSILVTGAGGSIGSELVRQIVKYNPKSIVLYDINESGLYHIEQELLFDQRQGNIQEEIEIVAIVGSINDKEKLRKIFARHGCNQVFHAAAYKHVPLMERTPREAINNNIFGTKMLIDVSIEFKVKTFVNISTDKAVNPTNVMGATKRFVEMMIHSETCMKSKTRFVAVRFGNVLGSNGSVIPLFQKQIEQGGPVTVTDPNIVRYFMTIPEAVNLVLEASTLAKGGEIFVLDMGKPVKIKDLAEKMIQLSGYELNKDIQIKFVGLRPGEKLYEELLMDEEGLRRTANDLIFIAQPQVWEDEVIEKYLQILKNATMYCEPREIKHALQSVVRTYVFEER